MTWPAAERGLRSCAARDAGFRQRPQTRRRQRRRRSPPWNSATLAARLSISAGSSRPRREQPAGQRVLGKFAHLHRVFERGSRAADDRRVDGAGDRHDLEVELRRESSIETQLLVAEESPRRERREIEEAEIDRLLDLVRVGSGQQHERNVRLEFPGAAWRRPALLNSRAHPRALPDPSRRPRGVAA